MPARSHGDGCRPNETVPATEVSRMPWAVLLVVATLTKAEVAAKVPVTRPSARPEPLRITSGVVLLPTVSVPKLLPEILVPVTLPIVNPRRVFPCPSVTPTVAAMAVVIVGLPPPVVGKASLNDGTVTPAIVSRDCDAPAPISF